MSESSLRHNDLTGSTLSCSGEDLWEQLVALSQTHPKLPFDNIHDVVAAAEREIGDGFRFSEAQSEAVRVALQHQLCVVTGDAGAGKATLLRALRSRATAPLEYEVVALDRLSLAGIDQRVADLLVHLPDRPNHRIVFIGEARYLPPVGGGRVLTALINSGELPHVGLTEVFRQRTSPVVDGAAALEAPTSVVDTLAFRDLLLTYSSTILRSDMSGHVARQALVDHLEGVLAKAVADALQAASLDALHDAAAARKHALVPYRMTREMNEVLSEEGWTWEDLLAAAGAVTDEQYEAVSEAHLQAMRECLLEVVPLTKELLAAVAPCEPESELTRSVMDLFQRTQVALPDDLVMPPDLCQQDCPGFPVRSLTLNDLDEFVEVLRRLTRTLSRLEPAHVLVDEAVQCLRRHSQEWKDLVEVSLRDSASEGSVVTAVGSRVAPNAEGAQIADLAALVRQMARALTRDTSGLAAKANHGLADRALDYLTRKGLQGSPLRSESAGCAAGIELNPIVEVQGSSPTVISPRLSASIVAAQEFLSWNRAEPEALVAITKELFVAGKVIDLYCVALAAQQGHQELPDGYLEVREAAWRDSSRLLAVGLSAPRSPKFDEWFERGYRAARAAQ